MGPRTLVVRLPSPHETKAARQDPGGDHGGGDQAQHDAPVNRQTAVDRGVTISHPPDRALGRTSNPSRTRFVDGWCLVVLPVASRCLGRGLHGFSGLDRALGCPSGPVAQPPYVTRLLKEQECQDRQAQEGNNAQDGPDGLDRLHRSRRILWRRMNVSSDD
jgi:hypothetical protein